MTGVHFQLKPETYFQDLITGIDRVISAGGHEFVSVKLTQGRSGLGLWRLEISCVLCQSREVLTADRLIDLASQVGETEFVTAGCRFAVKQI